MRRRFRIAGFLVVALVVFVIAMGVGYRYARPLWFPIYAKVRGQRTVNDALDRYGDEARRRLTPAFQSAGVAYPPARVKLIGLKHEDRLELWAGDGATGELERIKAYPILAASGSLGPKLREGDRQVPEGIYRIEGLNPNSSYHLSMKLDYPNAFDQRHAEAEGRTEPGSNIFIHGKDASVGCLAMGDVAIEELFVLVADVGRENVQVVIAPNDLRIAQPMTDMATVPPWTAELYDEIRAAME